MAPATPSPDTAIPSQPTAEGSREHQPSSFPGGQIFPCFLAQPYQGLPLGQRLSSPSQTLNRQQHLHVYPITEQLSEQAKHILTLLRETETSTKRFGGGDCKPHLSVLF